jgi:selenocysteine lyase/cysteine desulfurase
MAGIAAGKAASASALAGARDIGDLQEWTSVRALFDMPENVAALQNATATVPFRAALAAALARYGASHDPRLPFAALLTDVEAVRQGLASRIGADPDCVAIVRNTTEAMRTVQFGLDFQPGDEVLAISVDYDLAVWRQSLVRQGVVLKTFDLPVPAPPAEEIVRLYERHMTDRTRYLLISEVISSSGQAMPVAAICAAARQRGILTFVDGAQGFALSGARVDTIGCDFYAASMHKWAGGPRGMGFLWIRKPLIEPLWPLLGNYADIGQAGPVVAADNVRKFEQVGTIPTALWAAQTAVLPYLDTLPPAVRRARMQSLRDRLMDALDGMPGLRFLHGRGEATMGICSLSLDRADHAAVARALRAEGVLVKALREGNVNCLRVSPSFYTSEAEIDRLAGALPRVLRQLQ